MIAEKIKNCCEIAQDTLDGAYGWLQELAWILAIVLIFNFIVKKMLFKLHQHFKQQNRIWKDSFVSALYKPLSYYIWFFAAVESLDLLQLPKFSQTYFEYKHLVLAIVATLNGAWFLMRWKKNIVRHMIIKSKKNEITLDHAKIDLVNKLATMLIAFLTVLVLMELTGRSFTTLIAFGGIGGLAIAFSSQEIIASFFGSMMIYLTHPFGIGDWIVLPEKNIEGHVEEIGWYMTRIRTFDKRPIYVPNAIFAKMVVVNPSRMISRQIKETIGIRYGDIDKLQEVIAEIKNMLMQHPDLNRSMPLYVHFVDFGAYSLDILMCAYTNRILNEDFLRVKEDIFFKIIAILKKHNAECAYPTTTLEIPSGLKVGVSQSLFS